MKAMNFQNDNPAIPFDSFKDHYKLVFDLTSMQDATENFLYPYLVEEPLGLELNLTVLLKHFTELIVSEGGISSIAFDKFVVVGKISKMDNVPLQQKLSRLPLVKYWYLDSIPSEYVPIPCNESIANIKTQLSNMQGEHRMMLANSRHKLFAHSLGRPSFLK